MSVHNAKLSDDTKHINRNIRIAIVASEFNSTLTQKLISDNVDLLKKEGFDHVDLFTVPGAFEIPALTNKVLEKGIYTVVITLGVVVRGSTPHFDYICTECCRGLMNLSLEYDTPLILGVLTCDTLEQAEERANNNYAIYALNFLTQRSTTEHHLDETYKQLLKEVSNELQT